MTPFLPYLLTSFLFGEALALLCASLTKSGYRSCPQPAERAYTAVSHNCSIFTPYRYTTHTQTLLSFYHSAQGEVTTHFVWKDCQSRALWIDNSLCLRLLVTERKVVWPPTLVGPRGQQNEDTKTRRLKDTWIPIRDHYYCLLTLFTLFWNLIWPAPKDVTYINYFLVLA